MIFGRNTTRDISKVCQISLAYRLMKLRITILKYHSWYLCQISLQIMLLPIRIDDKIIHQQKCKKEQCMLISGLLNTRIEFKEINVRRRNMNMAGWAILAE